MLYILRIICYTLIYTNKNEPVNINQVNLLKRENSEFKCTFVRRIPCITGQIELWLLKNRFIYLEEVLVALQNDKVSELTFRYTNPCLCYSLI